MIKGIILDLDMCILDTRSLAGSFFDGVLAPLRASTLPEKEAIEQALMTTSLDDVATLFSMPVDLLTQMRKAYREVAVPEGIKSFGDEEYLRDLTQVKILVTSGYTKFQQGKIDQLGIADIFDEIHIDSTDDPSVRKGKKTIFEACMKRHGWLASEVLVVGDNPVSELKAGKALSMITVQTVRPSIVRSDIADYHIESFSELSSLLT